ncbi:MAG TPA: peptidoglycan DD-metalloendopeptidase family protein [Kofleriaceae bacterium]|nr:peptidoglycan DD-metalloendopeptidase family protein [Kofleriaceae bacterium]
MRARSLIVIAILASAARAEIRDDLRAQLDAQWAVAQKTRTTIDGKLDARAAERAERARAAYRLLRDPAGSPWVDPAVRMAALRRRAAARHLLAIDRAEVSLLADELVRVDADTARLAADRAIVETIAIPAPDMSWPAKGEITRHFGTFVHPDSHATLSRHGLDLDVHAHAEAHAVADGVVRYAGPIRGLDLGVVVDHGSCWSVTAKLGELGVTAGDHVARGQRLGDAATHRLYLELRIPIGIGGMPIDPEQLLEPKPRD